jgi:EmrB/QacA subfamily drug resistance transporter
MPATAAETSPRPVSESAKRWTLIAAVLGSSIVFLDSTIVNVALPRIGRDLPRLTVGVLEGQSYVYNAYLLTLSALLILAGALNDFFGRRKMFITGLAGFGITSLACGVAPNMEFLIGARVLQGAFGAMLVPGSLALITVTFSGEEQGHAFGVWAGASAGTTILGPFIGGLLVDSISWRLAFLINLPLIVFALWATRAHVQESRDENSTANFDWTGSVLVALAIGGLTFGAIYGGQHDWSGALPFAALGVGALMTVLIPFYMSRVSNPLIPIALFRFRNFTVTNISTLVIYGALYVTGYYSGIFLQGTIGYTAAAAGLAGIPGFILLAVFSSRVGKLSARTGPRLFMAAGPVVMAAGIFLLSLIPASSTAWNLRLSWDHLGTLIPPLDYVTQVLPGYVLFGLGLTLLVAPLTTALMTSVPARNSGVASAFNNAISRVGPQLAGAAIFIAIAGTFYTGFAGRIPGSRASDTNVRAHISALNAPSAADVRAAFAQSGVNPSYTSVQTAARDASTDAFHLAMYVALGLLLAGAAVNLVGIRNRPIAGEAGSEPEA